MRPIAAQEATGTTLWRVAAATVPTPPALAIGPLAALWNPAQRTGSARVAVPRSTSSKLRPTVDASGVITTVRIPVKNFGELGLIYGRVGSEGDIEPDDRQSRSHRRGAARVHTSRAGTWSRRFGSTDLGATLAFHQTRLDTERTERMTFDLGATHTFSDVLRIAAATHFFFVVQRGRSVARCLRGNRGAGVAGETLG